MTVGCMAFYLGPRCLRLSEHLVLLLLAWVPPALCWKRGSRLCPSLWALNFALFLLLAGFGLNTCCTAHPDISLGFLPHGFCSPVHSPLLLAALSPILGSRDFSCLLVLLKMEFANFRFPFSLLLLASLQVEKELHKCVGQVHTTSCLLYGSLLPLLFHSWGL